MVAWAKENARSSGLADAPIRWIVDDCAKFVEREIRRGRRYDAIIMDPPATDGATGEVWRLEENLYPFVELVRGVLSDQPLFVILNSYTTGLAPSVVTYILETLLSRKFGGRTDSQELASPSPRAAWSSPAAPPGAGADLDQLGVMGAAVHCRPLQLPKKILNCQLLIPD